MIFRNRQTTNRARQERSRLGGHDLSKRTDRMWYVDPDCSCSPFLLEGPGSVRINVIRLVKFRIPSAAGDHDEVRGDRRAWAPWRSRVIAIMIN